ncbi:hypothetical protein GJ744_004024 [Endocarpon pusillum]|uniref:Uncharacterized protein n=1 Tax=Endocarpon pusillum TaxID=364733 RepID=A0A8H7A9Y5_9EURO|nr:hypothetical protein GJ744_004024 [Endocarpon pusillum]
MISNSSSTRKDPDVYRHKPLSLQYAGGLAQGKPWPLSVPAVTHREEKWSPTRGRLLLSTSTTIDSPLSPLIPFLVCSIAGFVCLQRSRMACRCRTLALKS